MIPGTTTIDTVVRDLIGDTDGSHDSYVNYVRLAKNFIRFELRYHSNLFEAKVDLPVGSANTVQMPADYYQYKIVYDGQGRSYGKDEFTINKDKTVLTFICYDAPSNITLVYVSNDINPQTFQIDDVFHEAMKSYILWKSKARRANVSLAEKREYLLSYEREMNLAKQKNKPFRLYEAEGMANALYPFVANRRI